MKSIFSISNLLGFVLIVVATTGIVFAFSGMIKHHNQLIQSKVANEVIESVNVYTISQDSLVDEQFENIHVKNTIIGDTVWIGRKMYRVIK